MAAPKKLLQQQQEIIAAMEAEKSATPEPVVENPVVAIPATVGPAEVTATVPSAPAAENYEQQFRTAQGLLEVSKREIREAREDAERKTAALQQEVDRLSKLVKEQMESMDAMLSKQDEPAKPYVAPETPAAESLTDDDREALGGEFVEATVRKIAKQESIAILQLVDARIQALRDEFQSIFTPVKNQVETIALSAEEQKKINKFNAALAEQVSNCAEIHNSQEFAQWIIGKEDVYSGAMLVDIYNKAVTETLDANVVARIQKAFLRDMEAKPAPVPDPAPINVPADESQNQPIIPAGMEDQISPARGNVGNVPFSTPATDPITDADVAEAGNAYARNRTEKNKQTYEELKARLYRKTAAQSAATGKK